MYDSIWLRREDLLRVHTSQFVLLNASIWDFWAVITQILSCSSLSPKTMHWWVDRVRRCKRSWLWIIEVNYELPAHTLTHSLWLCELSHTRYLTKLRVVSPRVSGGVTKDGERENFISICTPACFVCLISSCTRVPIVSHWGIVQSKQHLRTWDAAF